MHFTFNLEPRHGKEMYRGAVSPANAMMPPGDNETQNCFYSCKIDYHYHNYRSIRDYGSQSFSIIPGTSSHGRLIKRKAFPYNMEYLLLINVIMNNLCLFSVLKYSYVKQIIPHYSLSVHNCHNPGHLFIFLISSYNATNYHVSS